MKHLITISVALFSFCIVAGDAHAYLTPCQALGVSCPQPGVQTEEVTPTESGGRRGAGTLHNNSQTSPQNQNTESATPVIQIAPQAPVVTQPVHNVAPPAPQSVPSYSPPIQTQRLHGAAPLAPSGPSLATLFILLSTALAVTMFTFKTFSPSASHA